MRRLLLVLRAHLLRPVFASVLALGLVLTAAGTAAAMPPQGSDPAAAAAKGGGGTGGGGGGGGKTATRGFDISYPQCDDAYPARPAFAIVGVNGGRVFSVNPCLASQITWGGGAAAELYANTGNPGPGLSQFWPTGQTSPRVCAAASPDTADCAYDYGWNAAKHSFDTATAAYAQLGLSATPAATAWWLDVETMNSWRTDTALNVAALQGGVDYLRSVGVARIGVYSTTVQWREITGGTTAFAALPSWGAGAPSEKAAKQHCVSTPGFTGGRLAMVQYIWSGFDADVRC
ncbi:MAG TPA: hypothetical protein VFP56_01190 [Candidatus Limnocylindrales bacterium]|nr:hypothetical protein [Candidatus Limnocylindrales bacterium]